MIDHAAVRERLELAAVEPDGLDRLAAGDTADASAIAGHLAGCPVCAEEARRLATLGPVVRDAFGAMPREDLRERTLALVREVGRDRRPAASIAAPMPRIVERPTPRRSVRWPVGLAAAVVLSLVAGGLIVGARLGPELRDQQAQTAGLAALDAAVLRLSGQADAIRLVLVGRDPAAAGTLLYSTATKELAVSASGLPTPAAGQELSCWVAGADGVRTRMGRMVLGAGLAYWAGWSEALGSAGPGSTFGVTLVDSAGAPVGPGDVLTGSVPAS